MALRKKIVNKKKLVIPHPRYSVRDFVLIPLLELNDTLKDPETGVLVSDFLVKPFSMARFQKTMDKVIKDHQNQSKVLRSSIENFLYPVR